MLINDIDIKPLGFSVGWSYGDDLFPTVSYNAVSTPGRPGKRKNKSDIGEKSRPFRIDIKNCESQEELEQKIEELKGFFKDEKGTLTTAKIQVTDGGRHFYAVLEGSTPVERKGSVGKVDIELVSYDPFTYENAIQYSLTSFPAGFYCPSGMYETPPVFTFTFSEGTSDFRVTHLDKTHYVRLLDHSFSAGDELVIDMKDEVVRVNGSRINDKITFESDFFSLNAGENNINVNTAGELMIEYKPRFL